MPGMTAGSVDRTTISATTGAAGSSSGAAGALYAAAVTYFAGLPTPQPPPAPTLGQVTLPFTPARPADSTDVADGNAARLMQFRFWADFANFFAAFVPYIQTNALVSPAGLKATVTNEVLGTVSATNPVPPGSAIVPPGGSGIDIPVDCGILPGLTIE